MNDKNDHRIIVSVYNDVIGRKNKIQRRQTYGE